MMAASLRLRSESLQNNRRVQNLMLELDRVDRHIAVT
jgi:hypothetical protein